MHEPRSDSGFPVLLRPGSGGITVVAFPFAGGSARSMAWLSPLLPEGASLYGIRPVYRAGSGGGLPVNPDEAASLYLERCRPLMGPRTVFFGHSMGALAAYGCIERYERETGTTIGGLVISGMNPPVEGLYPFPDSVSWDDERLIGFLCGLGGIPDEIRTNRELLEYFIQAVLTDLDACRRMARPTGRLMVRAMVLSGRNDRCLDPGALGLWQDFFGSPVVFRECGEGHFYYERESEQLRRLLHSFISSGEAVLP